MYLSPPVGGTIALYTAGRSATRIGVYMTTFHDVPANFLLPVLADKLAANGKIVRPEWALHVKTGVHRERPPTQENWWDMRAAAVLRKVGMNAPIGVNHLSQMFGGPRDRGSSPNRAKAGSRHIIRTVLQQLEEAGLVEVKTNVTGTVRLGRGLTAEGQKLLDGVAHEVLPQALEVAPGLAKY